MFLKIQLFHFINCFPFESTKKKIFKKSVPLSSVTPSKLSMERNLSLFAQMRLHRSPNSRFVIFLFFYLFYLFLFLTDYIFTILTGITSFIIYYSSVYKIFQMKSFTAARFNSSFFVECF